MRSKSMLLVLTLGTVLSFTGCTKEETEDAKKNDEWTKVEIEENTPQEWINLFTFTNVTIVVKDSLLLKGEGRQYKVVDSKWYVKEQNEISFNEFKENPATIYQLAYAHYSKFTYDESYYYYKAENMKVDNTDYRYTVTVQLDCNSTEKRIGAIYSDAYVSGSLSIASSMEFKDYGVTTL